MQPAIKHLLRMLFPLGPSSFGSVVFGDVRDDGAGAPPEKNRAAQVCPRQRRFAHVSAVFSTSAQVFPVMLFVAAAASAPMPATTHNVPPYPFAVIERGAD
jgi:hypothetical protein